MRIYISGPITGVEERERNLRFFKASERLRSDPHYGDAELFIPLTANEQMPLWFSHADYMRVSLTELDICDAVYFIRGWEKSLGCCEEHGYALGKGKTVIYEEDEDA